MLSYIYSQTDDTDEFEVTYSSQENAGFYVYIGLDCCSEQVQDFMNHYSLHWVSECLVLYICCHEYPADGGTVRSVEAYAMLLA